MRKDSRLSRALHALIHLAQYDKPVTSEEIGKMLRTNPVVVRRTMGLLREHGYVKSVKGHHGGWTLNCSLHHVTLLDIHHCLGEQSVFTIGLTDENTHCLIEQAVNQTLKEAMDEAELILINRFKEVSLADLSEKFMIEFTQLQDEPHSTN
ncbi:Rrf2 family transcriptional regulator [Alteromonas sp. C1M14]|uniref:Rrf2 family transcriptional regulator n=1 Tax=Alteromonas sp. C1M14 TaxID=2841567 RepID=UPI001C0973AC|nr:Rrf2 family transcriptional regulator [Alteromonas sp. C1M14]MBU2977101.1 Rrf2 family transcriptional regulator [Alteromonas sp. C1M14]